MRSLSLLVALVVLVGCEGLTCPCWSPDYRRDCTVPTDCRGGLASDQCGCCQVCAKVLGEVCGGPWNTVGLCDTGLECYKKNPEDFNASGLCVVASTPKAEDNEEAENTDQ